MVQSETRPYTSLGVYGIIASIVSRYDDSLPVTRRVGAPTNESEISTGRHIETAMDRVELRREPADRLSVTSLPVCQIRPQRYQLESRPP